MKSLIYISLLFLIACSTQRPTSEMTFFVEGSCAECQSLIEASMNELEGVKQAQWSLEMNRLWVVYETKQLTVDSLQKVLSEAGFNTQYYQANEAAREKLPPCCLKPFQAEEEAVGDTIPQE